MPWFVAGSWVEIAEISLKRCPMLVRSCLKFLAILKRLNFQGAVSGFCLPIGCYFGAFLRFSRPIAWLSSFEKRGKIPRNFLPMPQTNKFKQLLKASVN